MLNTLAAVAFTSLPDPQTVSVPLTELKQTCLLLHHNIHKHLLWADNTRHNISLTLKQLGCYLNFSTQFMKNEALDKQKKTTYEIKQRLYSMSSTCSKIHCCLKIKNKFIQVFYYMHSHM
jgi:hypothetical protein